MDEDAIERRVTARVCEKLLYALRKPFWAPVREELEAAIKDAEPPWVTKALHVERWQDENGYYWAVSRIRDLDAGTIGQRRFFYVTKGGNETDSTVPGQFGDEPHPITRLRSWAQAQEAMARAAAWEAAGR